MFGSIGDLLSTVITIFIFILIVRAIFSWFPQMLYSEAGRIIVLATEWYLAPIRRIIPPAGGLDLSFLVGIVLLYALQLFVRSGHILAALIAIGGDALVFCIVLVLLRILLGFLRIDPWPPITQMVIQANEPFARPFRQWLPRRPGQFDWAPGAAVVVLLGAYDRGANLPPFRVREGMAHT